MQSAQVTFLPGDTLFDTWEVEAPLGRGGMGSVYRCRNHQVSRIRVAIKVLDANILRHPSAMARFRREAEILATVDHPNVVRVNNVHLETSPPFLEMEFVDGAHLQSLIANHGAFPRESAVAIARSLADALSYLHARQIYHRDIKPENILMRTDGTPKLVDFGLALERGTTRITQTGQGQFGTVAYCPPEWMNVTEVDAATWDLYALGVVFYELLTGSFAFMTDPDLDPRNEVMQVMTEKHSVPYLDPGEGFDEPVRALVRDLTARDIQGRPRSAVELIERLDALTNQATLRPAPNRVPGWLVGAFAAGVFGGTVLLVIVSLTVGVVLWTPAVG